MWNLGNFPLLSLRLASLALCCASVRPSVCVFLSLSPAGWLAGWLQCKFAASHKHTHTVSRLDSRPAEFQTSTSERTCSAQHTHTRTDLSWSGQGSGGRSEYSSQQAPGHHTGNANRPPRRKRRRRRRTKLGMSLFVCALEPNLRPSASVRLCVCVSLALLYCD